MVIGRLEHGWSWQIPLPGPRLSVGVVMNKDRARRFGATPEEQLEGAIENDARLAAAAAQRRRVTPVATYANYQLISERGAGPGWAMVGDAFGFVDPMLSPGLCMAMASAERLADAIPRTRRSASARSIAHLARYDRWFRETLERVAGSRRAIFTTAASSRSIAPAAIFRPALPESRDALCWSATRRNISPAWPPASSPRAPIRAACCAA